ncbi:MAG: DUF1972 domain-containing protein [Rubrivivax sp.]|nr:DUF1972 domain-containing protein [Rubrivivax sp.]
MTTPTLRILGTRGVPAAHGGFETFAERLALHLVGRGWRVVVYCQEDGDGPVVEDRWQGVERVRIPVAQPGPRGTVVFDWQATRHAARHRDLCLTLGYNTAAFGLLLRWRGVRNVTNMDGIEWRRRKWGLVAKTWFWLNDWAGCWLGDHLVADHPGIAAHLLTRGVPGGKVTMIPYGADEVTPTSAPTEPVTRLGLRPGQYWTVIARPEPENSLLEIVQAYSRRERSADLVVLGRYEPETQPYHRAVINVASRQVRFVGAIYDATVVGALRAHATGYVHGHQVGGTNPSLVEAMGAGNAVIAHDNPFNRWVLGNAGRYFRDAQDCAARFDGLLEDTSTLELMRGATRQRFREAFTWPDVLTQYEKLLHAQQPRA